MTLNKDLFGNFIPEKPAAVPVSVRKNNKVRVFHMSWNEEPPHERFGDPDKHKFHKHDNVHPKAIHAGTAQAASTFYRHHVHEYEIDLNHPDVSSVVWGDSPITLEEDKTATENLKNYSEQELQRGVYTPRVADFNKAMSGVQEGLFENTSPNVHKAVQKKMVLPYRNRREDMGSISYIIPKMAVGDPDVGYPVRYVGRHDDQTFRESLTGEDQ